MNQWDFDFLSLAKFWAERRSKDPNTKVGAVLVGPDNTILSLAYNGFPRGVDDDSRLLDRELKNEIVVHAEMNALMFAGRDTWGSTIYVWPMPPCSRCMGPIIQAGVARVVAPKVEIEKWRASIDRSRAMAREAGIAFEEV